MDIAEPVLVVAADRRELEELLRSDVERLNWPVDFAARAGRWLLVANGAGPIRSAEAVEVAQRSGPLKAIVSTGYCGALDRELKVADIVVATEVNGVHTNIPSSTRRFAAGAVVSLDRVVQTMEEKARLRKSGAIAVEMEAAGVAERAAGLGLPFYCVRVVTDCADESMTIDFNAARDDSGRIRTARVVREAVRRPWEGLPELLMLARRSRQATRALGEFFADCRIN